MFWPTQAFNVYGHDLVQLEQARVLSYPRRIWYQGLCRSSSGRNNDHLPRRPHRHSQLLEM